MPLEPRAAIGEYDARAARYTLYSVSQGVHRHKNGIAGCLGVTTDEVRVITGDVGGGFGVRSPCYPEYPLLLWAAQRLGRPVKWTATRAEASSAISRRATSRSKAALALDADGRFLALSIDYVGNLGAYPVSFAVLGQRRCAWRAGSMTFRRCMSRVRGVATNTLPVGVYRGAGRPEATFMLERLIDLAAAELALDRAELRRRNLIRRALPYQSPLGHRYDSGAFAENLASALRTRRMGPGSRRGARRRRRAGGCAASAWRITSNRRPAIADERTDITRAAPRAGHARSIGTRRSGPGPRDELRASGGRPASRCRWSTSRSCSATAPWRCRAAARIPTARCGSAARSWCAPATRSSRAAGKLAAHELEAAERGHRLCRRALHRRRHGPRRLFGLSFDDPRRRALRGRWPRRRNRRSASMPIPTAPRRARSRSIPRPARVRSTRYVTVDDVGRVINPMIVEGQVHGGIAQSVGQALMEDCVYDARAAQLLAGSFMDYAMPRADDLPWFVTASERDAGREQSARHQGRGRMRHHARDGGDDRRHRRRARHRAHLEMPATPERVWRAHRRLSSNKAGRPEFFSSAARRRSIAGHSSTP